MPLISYLDRMLSVVQVLVTHHVELVLPGAYYLVRMLDGRIDTQGTIQDLRANGILDDIAPAEELEAHKEELAVEAANLEIDSAGQLVEPSQSEVRDSLTP